jgi:hypothetical protein
LEFLLVTAVQAVCTATAASVVVAIALVVAGVALLAGVGWALITAGALLGPCAAAGGVALLRDDGRKP